MSRIDIGRLLLGGIFFAVSLATWSAPPGSPPVMLSPAQSSILNAATMPTAIAEPKIVSETFTGYLPPKNPIDYFKENKSRVIDQLANHDVAVRAYSVETDGNISFLTSLIVGKNKTIVVQQDYINYKNVVINGKPKKVGVLFRIEATLVTKNSDVNLNGLFAIGLAVRQGSVNGNLKVQVHGLSGEPISNLIPFPSEITESSLQNAMQAIAALKAKMFDSNVNVIPQDIPESL